MGALDTNPAASHYAFPYYFTDNDETAPDGNDLHGIAFRSYTVSYDGDMLIYYGDLSDSSTEFIDCWCSRWDVQNYSVVIETWLKKDDLQTLKDNITPGAVGELYVILGRPRYYDATWQRQNTLRIRPNPFTGREYATRTWYSGSTGNLIYMRNEVVCYPKNITEHPLDGPSGWIEVKIDALISGSSGL